jgi:hypothetical protein
MLISIYDEVMLFVVVPCCSYVARNLVPIHYCYTILPHNYTHSFRHPTFCKIVHLSSHMFLSVKLMLINPCIPLGGSYLYKFGK